MPIGRSNKPPKFRRFDDAAFAPPELQRDRSRVIVPKEKVWLRSPVIHMGHIHSFHCHYCGHAPGPYEIQACHLRWDTDGCGQEKPSDYWCWPGCVRCHAIQGGMVEWLFHAERGEIAPHRMILVKYGMTSPDPKIGEGARIEFERRGYA